MMGEMLMTLEGVRLTVGNGRKIDVPPLNLEKGKGYLITGSNETMKTTLLKAMGGLVPYDEIQGQVSFQGVDLYDASEDELQEVKKKIAFVFAEGTLISNLSIRENLLLPVRYHSPGADVSPWLQKIEEGFRYWDIPTVLDYRPAEISYSTRKAITFLRAALREPLLILLDKPLFNLAAKDRQRVRPYLEMLKQKGTALVITSHYDDQLESLMDETIQVDPPV